MTISPAARFHIVTKALTALLLSGGLMAGVDSVSAQDDKTWKVNDLRGGPKKNGGFKDSEDVSGLACAQGDFPKLCIIADDETQGAQVVILKDGEMIAGDFISLINDTFGNEALELDAEGVAYADGSFYVIGSHGRARHERKDLQKEALNNAKAQATRRVFRIGFEPGSVDMQTGKIKTPPKIGGSSALGEIIKVQEKLRQSFDESLEDNGLTVEGVAAKGGKLYVGMRGPVLDGKSAILEVPIPAVFDGKPGEAVLRELELGKDSQGKPRGVRDLVPHVDGFLVIAGPLNDPKNDDDYVIQEGDYTVFSWNGSATKPDGKFDLKAYGKKVKVKPEAILPLEEQARNFRALVLFDGPDNGTPTPVTINLK